MSAETQQPVAAPSKPQIDMAKPVQNDKTVADLIAMYKRSFEMAAPRHLDVTRFMRLTLMEITRNPMLLDCTAGSLLGAIITAVQLGLEIGGPLGQAYLVPFKNQGRREAQLIPGYKGLLRLARNSGEISTITANVVYKKDKFNYQDGLDQILEHFPGDHDEKDEEIIYAYAVARFKDGGHQVVVLTRRALDKIRKSSKSSDSPAYKEWLPEMFKKAAIRRLSKLLPLSPELSIASALDERAHLGVPQDINLLTDGDRAEAIVAGDPPMPPPQGGDDRSEGALVLVSGTQQGKLLAWIKQYKWTETETRQMLKRLLPDIDVTVGTLQEVICQIPDKAFDSVIDTLEKGQNAARVAEVQQPSSQQQEAAGSPVGTKPPAAPAKADPEAEITEDQYSDLWAMIVEKEGGPVEGQKFAKSLGYSKLRAIKQKDLKKIADHIQAFKK